LVALFVLAAAGVWLFTLGYDEAWILQGASDAIRPRSADLNVIPVATTGGVCAVAQLTFARLFGQVLWINRLFSLSCAIVLGVALWRWGRSRFGSSEGGLLVLTGWAATPGTVVFSASAYGCIPAFLLMLSALHFNAKLAARRNLRVPVVAILSGLAAATRPEAVVLWPVLIGAALFRREGRLRETVEAVAIALLGATVFAGSVYSYAHFGQLSQVVGKASDAAGFGGWGLINYPFFLNKWVVSQKSLPLLLAMLATCAGFASESWLRPESGQQARSPVLYLVLFGWATSAAWLLKSPIPHLRYLWPSAAAFFLVLGVGMAALHAYGCKSERPLLRLIPLLIAVAGTLTGVGAGARQLIFGESNVLSWEWSGESKVSYFTRFRNVQYQRQAADFLRKSTGEQERVLALGLNRELAYLSGRNVLEGNNFVQNESWNSERLPRRLLLGPVAGNYLYLTDFARHWVEANCTLEAQFGPYAFYRVTGKYPEDPAALQLEMAHYPGHPLTTTWH
jgi:hypothetical protein